MSRERDELAELADGLDGAYWRRRYGNRAPPPTLVVDPAPEKREEPRKKALRQKARKEDEAVDSEWLDGKYWQETGNTKRALRRLQLEAKRARSPERGRREHSSSHSRQDTLVISDVDDDGQDEELDSLVVDSSDEPATAARVAKRRRISDRFSLAAFLEADECIADDQEDFIVHLSDGSVSLSVALVDLYKAKPPTEFWPPLLGNKSLPTETLWHMFLALHRLEETPTYDWVSAEMLLDRHQVCEQTELLSRVVYLAELWSYCPLRIVKTMRPHFGLKFDIPQAYLMCANFKALPSLRDSASVHEVWIELVHCYLRFLPSKTTIDEYFLRDNVDSPSLNVALSVLLAKAYGAHMQFLQSPVLRHNNLVGYTLIMRCFKTLEIDLNLMYPPLLDLIYRIDRMPEAHFLDWLVATFEFVYNLGENLSSFYQRICINLFAKKNAPEALNFVKRLFKAGFRWNKEMFSHLQALYKSVTSPKVLVYRDALFNQFANTAANHLDLTVDDLGRALHNAWVPPYMLDLCASFLGELEPESPRLAFDVLGRALALNSSFVLTASGYDPARLARDFDSTKLDIVMHTFALHAKQDAMDAIVPLVVACGRRIYPVIRASGLWNESGFAAVLQKLHRAILGRGELSALLELFRDLLALDAGDATAKNQCVEFAVKFLLKMERADLSKHVPDPLYGILRSSDLGNDGFHRIVARFMCSPPCSKEPSKYILGIGIVFNAVMHRMQKLQCASFLDLDVYRHCIYHSHSPVIKPFRKYIHDRITKMLPFFTSAERTIVEHELKVQITRQVVHADCMSRLDAFDDFPVYR